LRQWTPAQTDIKTTAQDLYDHKHDPEEIEFWNVFARYQKYPKIVMLVEMVIEVLGGGFDVCLGGGVH